MVHHRVYKSPPLVPVPRHEITCRAVALVVSRRLPTAATWVQAQDRTCVHMETQNLTRHDIQIGFSVT
jgi:hypothetical protein